MKFTEALKGHMKQFGLADGASDDEVQALVSSKLIDGSLSQAKFQELQGQSNTSPADKLKSVIAEANRPFAEALASQSLAITKLAEAIVSGKSSPADDAAAVKAAADAKAKADAEAATKNAGTFTADQLDELVTKAVATALDGRGLGESQHTAFEVLKGAAAPRVKAVAERYSQTKSAVAYPVMTKAGRPHPLAGEMAKGWDGGSLDTASHLDLAVCGAYLKWTLQPKFIRALGHVPRGFRMTEEDQDLIKYALHEMPWNADKSVSGSWEHSGKLTDWMRKDIVDDATSGGLEAAPIVFDDRMIEVPVLNGELAPLVEMITLARGRRVEGVASSNPTINSGPAEDGSTAITLETTTGFITAVDTTIFNATGAIRLGLDWMEDTPIRYGEFLTRQFGEKFLEWLDNQIANGDGTTEPLGIFNTTSTNLVPTANGQQGPLLLGDLESLVFGISKAYRNAKGKRNVFVCHDNTYRRMRSMPVGNGDARRLLDSDGPLESYMSRGYPVKVQNNISVADLAFVNMAYYRLYRRKGFQLDVVTEGQTLKLLNEMLIVARARYGGRMTTGSAVAEANNVQSVG